MALKNEHERDVDQQLAEVIADAVDQFANRRGATGPAGKVAVRAIQHMPRELPGQARECRPRPRQLQKTGGGGGGADHAGERDLIRRDRRGEQAIDEGARDRMHQMHVRPGLDLPGPSWSWRGGARLHHAYLSLRQIAQGVSLVTLIGTR